MSEISVAIGIILVVIVLIILAYSNFVYQHCTTGACVYCRAARRVFGDMAGRHSFQNANS